MRIPLWKKWLSYLVEFHMESAPSDINPHLYVSLNRGRYQLCTANAVYSHADLYDNFLKTFQRLRLDDLPGTEVLVLGLGLGSVPYMLERIFHRTYAYTAVEIDESVIYLADKYGLSDLHSPMQTICADARSFVGLTEESYDLIAMDIFLDDTVPADFESIEFLQALRELLSPGGLLLYNRLAVTKKDRQNTRTFYQDRFRRVFPKGAYLEVGGNWMLLSHPDLLKAKN